MATSISQYLYKYLCDMNPKFKELVKINSTNLIYKKYMDEIYKDDELKKLWLETLANINEITEMAKIKYKKKPKNFKEYRRVYYNNLYKNNDEYRESKLQYHRNRYKLTNDLKKENEELKNKINCLESQNNAVNVC